MQAMSKGGARRSVDIFSDIPEMLVDCAKVLAIIDNFQSDFEFDS